MVILVMVTFMDDDIPPEPELEGWTTCPSCGCINRSNGPCKTKNCPANPRREQSNGQPVLRMLLSEGTRALTPEQTRQVRVELSAISPTTRTVRHDTWRLEVELEGRGSGEVRVVLPRDRAASGSLTWSPDGEWVDESVSQLDEPEPSVVRESNGGRAIAAAMLARLESKR